MFKPSTLRMMWAALAVLAVAFVLQSWSAYRPPQTIPLPIDLENIAQEDIDQVTIITEDSRLTFDKKNGQWSSGKDPVSDEFLKLWQKAAALQGIQVVSSSKDSHTAYGVGDGQGKRLLFIRKGAVITELIIGNLLGINGAYFRIGGNDTVYEVKGALTLDIGKDASSWIKKRSSEKPNTASPNRPLPE